MYTKATRFSLEVRERAVRVNQLPDLANSKVEFLALFKIWTKELRNGCKAGSCGINAGI